jgi:hypothetical protein
MPVMTPDPPTDGPTKDKLELGGIVALVAPLAATLGLFQATGTIGRLQRDQPFWLLVAVVLVLIAGGLLTIASYINGANSDSDGLRSSLRILGTLAAIAGFVLAVGLIIGNADNESRPRIAASLDESESKLSADVSASNLATSDHLEVKVDLATLKSHKTLDDAHPFRTDSKQLERAYVGPDSDGEAKEVISIPIPAGGEYTDVVIKAYTQTQEGCLEPTTVSGNAGTACMYLTLDPGR